MSLRIASLNLHCGLDSQGRPYPLAAAIDGLGADVVLLQENWRPDGSASLARRAAPVAGFEHLAELDVITGTSLEALNIVRGRAVVPQESGSWGIAVLSRFPMRSYRTVSLGAAPGDVTGARMAQIIEISYAGGLLRLVNVHLTHRLRHGPGQLRRLVRALAGSPVPTVIGGDLNMCRPAVFLARGYRPMLRGRTWPAERPVAQIDHLLASPGVEALQAGVAPAVGSDHRPVRATLVLTGVANPKLPATAAVR